MKPVRALIAASLAALALNAHAVDVPTDGSWIEFDFDAQGSSLYDLISNDTAFTFTVSQNSVLRIVDAGFSGDRFSITVSSLGTTLTSAPVAQDVSEDPVFDAAAVWADSRFSKGSWALGAGTYTVTGVATASPFEGGFGYLSVTAVPEPESFAMLLAGLGLVGAIARRRAVRQA